MSSGKRETRDLQAAKKQAGDEDIPKMTWPLWPRTTLHDLVGLLDLAWENGRVCGKASISTSGIGVASVSVELQLEVRGTVGAFCSQLSFPPITCWSGQCGYESVRVILCEPHWETWSVPLRLLAGAGYLTRQHLLAAGLGLAKDLEQQEHPERLDLLIICGLL